MQSLRKFPGMRRSSRGKDFSGRISDGCITLMRIQAAASIICVDAEGRLLLGRRTDNHMWGYSGGAVEIDEKIEDCARRELFEEMGITAGELELFYINSGPEAHYVYPNGDEVSNVEIVYICRDYRGKIRPQQEEIEDTLQANRDRCVCRPCRARNISFKNTVAVKESNSVVYYL